MKNSFARGKGLVPQEDFEHVIQLLFKEEIRLKTEHSDAVRESGSYIEPPRTPIELLESIWGTLFPRTPLMIRRETERVYVGVTQARYSASEMSDGERVALYLIAKCLLAPAGTILVIDEPEMHLHKAIQNTLWDQLEFERLDCPFIYLTHDLEFAASRTGAWKIWLKECQGDRAWEWDEVPSLEAIPSDVLMQVLGSPRPVLFVEGEKGSLDYAIYSAVYPDYLVIPRGSSTSVVQSTKSLAELPEFPSLNISVYGIIDRDFRNDERIAELENGGIFCTSVAEVENLLCTKGVLDVVAAQQARKAEEVSREAEDAVFALVRREADFQASRRTTDIIRLRLGTGFVGRGTGPDELTAEVDELRTSIDVEEIYAGSLQLYQEILDNNDYEMALLYYKQKDLLREIAHVLGWHKDYYIERFLAFLDHPETRQAMIEAMRGYLPELPVD